MDPEVVTLPVLGPETGDLGTLLRRPPDAVDPAGWELRWTVELPSHTGGPWLVNERDLRRPPAAGFRAGPVDTRRPRDVVLAFAHAEGGLGVIHPFAWTRAYALWLFQVGPAVVVASHPRRAPAAVFDGHVLARLFVAGARSPFLGALAVVRRVEGGLELTFDGSRVRGLVHLRAATHGNVRVEGRARTILDLAPDTDITRLLRGLPHDRNPRFETPAVAFSRLVGPEAAGRLFERLRSALT